MSEVPLYALPSTTDLMQGGEGVSSLPRSCRGMFLRVRQRPVNLGSGLFLHILDRARCRLLALRHLQFQTETCLSLI